MEKSSPTQTQDPQTSDGDVESKVAAVEVEESTFTPAETKRLLRKVDWALLPFLSFLYLLSFLDRANIGNAKLAGLEADLGMKGKYDYNVCI